MVIALTPDVNAESESTDDAYRRIGAGCRLPHAAKYAVPSLLA